MSLTTRAETSETPTRTGRRYDVKRVAFYLAVLAGVVVPVVIFGPFLAFPLWGWFDPAIAGDTHFLHDLGFIGIVLAGVLGLATQLYRPTRRVAGIQQALVVFGVFLVALAGFAAAGDAAILEDLVFFGLLFGPAVIAASIHPAGRRVLRTRTAGRFSPVVAGLAVVAAIPLAAYAAGQYGLHWSGDEHAVINHYAGMVVFSGAVVALGLLASIRSLGWHIPLFSAAGLMALLGLASVVYPTVPSSVGTMWGAAALLWAVVFVAAGLLSDREEKPMANEEATTQVG